MLIRKALAILSVMLVALPGWAGPTAVGTVQSSADATLRGNSLVAGTSVFGGDTIEVGQQGNALIAFPSGSELVLSGNSRVEIVDGTGSQPIQFEVLGGQAKFRSAEKAPVTALLADATIRPKGASGVGFVNLLSPTAAMIGAEKGDLLVSTAHDNGTMTIPAGNAVTVRIAQDQNSPTAIHKGKGRVILVGVLIVGAAAGVAAGITLSESSHGKPLSPFQPK
jgi:hypothetical protein